MQSSADKYGDIELLFLGTGTSAGIPMIGCHCETCSSTDPRDKRTRPSVVISYGKTRVLVDTTPELRLQCCDNGVDLIDAVVYTHAHADHIMGLDDLRRFNALRNGPLDVWADAETHGRLNRCFGYAFKEPPTQLNVFRPKLVARMIDGSFEIGAVKWTPIPLMHGEEPILGFRIGNMAYCTDVSHVPETTYSLLENLDVLVLDALQYKKHPTHLTIDEALAVVDKLKPKRTFFTHIAHAIKHDPAEAKLPEHVRLAYDGLRVLSPSPGQGEGRGEGRNAE
jgi:phosphoribosyl 1,2-cyclic phosphate phosphodiesterase